MIKLLVKTFIKDYNNTNNSKVRAAYGILSGVLGIICNVFLFIVKLTIGLILNSFAILTDGFNNLSDSFSSTISIISSKLSNKKPDKEHPFGHGRIEYVASLVLAFLILFFGFELFVSALKNLISGFKGETLSLASGKILTVSLIILSVSLLVKLWMFIYNTYLSKKINSLILKATAIDSISDVFVSTALVISIIISNLFFKNYYIFIDASLSIIVSIIICINGLKIVKQTISNLIGKPASKEDIMQIEKIVKSHNKVLDFHDLLVHDYGANQKFASVHVEVDSEMNITEAHEIADDIENICLAAAKIHLTVHIDPIDVNSSELVELNSILTNTISNIDKELSYHDLRIVKLEEKSNVIFDLVIPFDYSNKKVNDIINDIKSKVSEINPRYTLVIKIDHSFSE